MLNDNKILIVEDDDLNYKFLEVLLRGRGIDYFRACNGMDAVNMVKIHNDFDLILMDIQLPIMNGFEATRRIKEIQPEIPIFALTANTYADEKQKCLNSGCSEFISKPLRRDTLFELLDNYLRVKVPL